MEARGQQVDDPVLSSNYLMALPRGMLCAACCIKSGCNHCETSNVQGACTADSKRSASVQTQVEAGFARVESDLDDIDLDSPHAKALYAQYKTQAKAEGWLAAA